MAFMNVKYVFQLSELVSVMYEFCGI